MAVIFIKYTSSDRGWAFWIAEELKSLVHMPHIHEWEIKGGDDIYACAASYAKLRPFGARARRRRICVARLPRRLAVVYPQGVCNVKSEC